jgi:hypothetical protein
MATKAETKSIKAEIRDLKKRLTARRKELMRVIQADRKTAREAIRNVDKNTDLLTRCERDVDQRIAILTGRLSA